VQCYHSGNVPGAFEEHLGKQSGNICGLHLFGDNCILERHLENIRGSVQRTFVGIAFTGDDVRGQDLGTIWSNIWRTFVHLMHQGRYHYSGNI
jgi:hypothetical protein